MRILKSIGFWLLVGAIVVYAVFPFYYAILSSMRSGSALFRVTYWPESFDFSNYVAVFREQPFARNIANSIIVAVTVVAISLLPIVIELWKARKERSLALDMAHDLVDPGLVEVTREAVDPDGRLD